MTTAYCVAGLGYGDEGKGATVDFICRTRPVSHVIRYNGGPQAAHNVVTPEGLHHTFSQFGSGTFVNGVQTFLSEHMMIDPLALAEEERGLHDVGVYDGFKRLTISPDCLVVTPFHRALNRIQLGITGKHNSCGRGIGVCRQFHIDNGKDALFIGDLRRESVCKKKLQFIQNVCAGKAALASGKTEDTEIWRALLNPNAVKNLWEHYKYLAERCHIENGIKYSMKADVVFEGAQGVLLDEKYGEPEFNTWSNTTFENALSILKAWDWQDDIKKIGVLRTYSTRHGDGPFDEEGQKFMSLVELHNRDDGPQGKFRIGPLNVIAIRYAMLACGGVDGVALNHLDIFTDWDMDHFERDSTCKVVIAGSGPTNKHRKWLVKSFGINTL